MKKFEITEEQVKQLGEYTYLVKEWFPEVFETKLQIGKWMKTPFNTMYCPKEKTDKGYLCYGINGFGKWTEVEVDIKLTIDDILATDQEVFEALKNEAGKRGFVKGCTHSITNGKNILVSVKSERYDFHKFHNKLVFNNWSIFENGKWAEIIKTYTKSEAEQLLNAKII